MTQVETSVRSQLEELMKFVVPMAEGLLERHGSFTPYGGATDQDGKHHFVADQREEDYESAERVLEFVMVELRKGAVDGRWRAAALVLDVRTEAPDEAESTDAIRVLLEHEDGTAIDVLLPYAVVEDRNRVDYGKLRAAAARPRIWKHV